MNVGFKAVVTMTLTLFLGTQSHAAGYANNNAIGAQRFLERWAMNNYIEKIHETAKKGTALQMVQVCREGRDINIVDYKGNTPAMNAVISKNYATLNVLVSEECGADLDSQNEDGQTALEIATEMNDSVSIQILSKTELAQTN